MWFHQYIVYMNIKIVNLILFTLMSVCHSFGSFAKDYELSTIPDGITYNSQLALTGWVALYDTSKNLRCYMCKEDYYSIKEPGHPNRIKREYIHLLPLGIVIKYSGAKIIWGFEGIKGLNWADAKEYVSQYSPDGYKWRLLTKVESQAICYEFRNFMNCFQDYYPNDISFLGAYCSIQNWTSVMSSDTWTRRSTGETYNYVYTLQISLEGGKTDKGYSTSEDEHMNVYPISSL